MLRAEQLALIQSANQQLLAIRQQEMQYYTDVFTSFGTQGSLIAGFTLAALTGLDVRDFEKGFGLPFWKGLFHILSAVAVAVSVHSVLTTTFANIYGPNLALRGPSGSMVRAVKGMIAEKHGIFLSFILSLLSFQIITLAATWVKMQTYAAVIASLVICTGGFYWYKHCLRIYNRFKFIEPDVEWRSDERDSDALRANETTDKLMVEHSITPGNTRSTFQIDSSMVKVKNPAAPTDREEDENKKSSPQKNKLGHKSIQKSNEYLSDTASNASSQSTSIFMEGYLSKMNKDRLLSRGEWNRRYFVLKGNNMFYYKSREDYERDPTKGLRNRPICLSQYSVKNLSNNDQPPFEFELHPTDETDERRTWRFRCDLLDEFNTWRRSFEAAVNLE